MHFDVGLDAAHDIHDKQQFIGAKMVHTDMASLVEKMIDYGSQVLLSTLVFKKEKVSLMLAVAMVQLASLSFKAQGVAVTMVDV